MHTIMTTKLRIRIVMTLINMIQVLRPVADPPHWDWETIHPRCRLIEMNRPGSQVANVVVATCAMVKSRYIGDGHPTFNRNPYNGYINPYYWVDDHPLLYGNNGSLDPSTHEDLKQETGTAVATIITRLVDWLRVVVLGIFVIFGPNQPTVPWTNGVAMEVLIAFKKQ